MQLEIFPENFNSQEMIGVRIVNESSFRKGDLREQVGELLTGLNLHGIPVFLLPNTNTMTTFPYFYKDLKNFLGMFPAISICDNTGYRALDISETIRRFVRT